jgi:hypothetical protein
MGEMLAYITNENLLPIFSMGESWSLIRTPQLVLKVLKSFKERGIILVSWYWFNRK